MEDYMYEPKTPTADTNLTPVTEEAWGIHCFIHGWFPKVYRCPECTKSVRMSDE